MLSTAVCRYRAKAAEEEKAKAAAIAALQEKKRLEEEEAERHRLAAIEQYKKEAERLVRQEEEAMRREEEERKRREAAAAAEAARKQAASTPADNAEKRMSMMHRRNSAAAKRQEMSKHLTLSKRAEAKMEPKAKSTAAELFGVESTPEEEWGVGKSKIWKALNPKPLCVSCHLSYSRPHPTRTEEHVSLCGVCARHVCCFPHAHLAWLVFTPVHICAILHAL